MYSIPPEHRRLEDRDPLYTHLRSYVASALNFHSSHPNFEICSLNGGRSVYLCRETDSGSSLVCKFFGGRYGLPQVECCNLLNHEFRCLQVLRLKGLDHFPLAVVRPFGKVEELGYLLAEEYVPGHSLDYYIGRAAHDGQRQRLVRKLDLLADFFSKLHRSTFCDSASQFSASTRYFDSLACELESLQVIGRGERDELIQLCDPWRTCRSMNNIRACLVHGDATPTNFILHPEQGVTAIDLERMHRGDPMYDIGMLAAELKHHFALRILDAEAAEPYISHFLRRYCRAYSVRESEFHKMTFRSRFYMALGELRIARNPWLPAGHRTWLVQEARRCLMD